MKSGEYHVLLSQHNLDAFGAVNVCNYSVNRDPLGRHRRGRSCLLSHQLSHVKMCIFTCLNNLPPICCTLIPLRSVASLLFLAVVCHVFQRWNSHTHTHIYFLYWIKKIPQRWKHAFTLNDQNSGTRWTDQVFLCMGVCTCVVRISPLISAKRGFTFVIPTVIEYTFGHHLLFRVSFAPHYIW